MTLMKQFSYIIFPRYEGNVYVPSWTYQWEKYSNLSFSYGLWTINPGLVFLYSSGSQSGSYRPSGVIVTTGKVCGEINFRVRGEYPGGSPKMV